MDGKTLRALAAAFTEESELNRVSAALALEPRLAGLKMYDAPVLGVALAEDPSFEALKKPEAVGSQLKLPREWLPGACAVISIFSPISQAIKQSNNADPVEPSPEWLHARVEGQVFIAALSQRVAEALRAEGFSAVVPASDERFHSCRNTNDVFTDAEGNLLPVAFTSNWSERHAARICGLGTFGLSKGLITPFGIAGRLGSIITDCPLEPDAKMQPDLYGNCTRCGACVRRCPAGAISLETGKNHVLCANFLAGIKARYAPHYGCGKCQTGVPCESRIPKSRQA